MIRTVLWCLNHFLFMARWYIALLPHCSPSPNREISLWLTKNTHNWIGQCGHIPLVCIYVWICKTIHRDLHLAHTRPHHLHVMNSNRDKYFTLLANNNNKRLLLRWSVFRESMHTLMLRASAEWCRNKVQVHGYQFIRSIARNIFMVGLQTKRSHRFICVV